MAPTAPGLVSVVIPAFNAAPWIGAAVASARAQQGAAVEVIVADNGSTDDTVDAARRSGTVRVVSAERRGPAAARNAGLAVARGEFVQFVDADDLIAPGKVERQLRLLEGTGADVAWGAFVRFDDGAADPWRGATLDPAIGDDVARDLIGERGFLHLGAALFRRSRLRGISFDESYAVVEDVRFLLSVALSGARFVRDRAPAGYAQREHASTERASRVAQTTFWDACAGNARFVRDAWRQSDGELSAERTDAVARVLLNAAEAYARAGDAARLDAALRDLRDLDPDFARRVRSPHRALVPLLGYGRTFALADSVKRVRDSLRGW